MKKIMKLALPLLFCIGLLFAAAACGNNDQALVDEALEALTNTTISATSTKLAPTFTDPDGKYGDIVITMSSSNTAVISNTGEITRTIDNQTVGVTITLTLNSATASKVFDYTVSASSSLVETYLTGILNTLTIPATTTGNITVPTINTTTYPGVTLAFKSSNTAVISTTGVVTRPVGADVSVTVTLTLTKGSTSKSKEFSVTVTGREPETDAERVAADLAAVKLPGATISNLTLPATGAYGSAITWASNNTSRITAAGVVSRANSSDSRVTMTATVTKGTETGTRNIDVYVLRSSTASDGAYARASINNQMFYLSMVDGEVWLDYAGLVFVNPAATTRKIEFAFDWTSSANNTVEYSARTWPAGWFANSISGDGMEYSFKINISEAFKTLSPSTDWVKFFLKVTEDGTSTYINNGGSDSGVSVVPSGGTGIAATWGTGNIDTTVQSFTDKNGDVYALKVDWVQIHLRKNG